MGQISYSTIYALKDITSLNGKICKRSHKFYQSIINESKFLASPAGNIQKIIFKLKFKEKVRYLLDF